MKTSTSGLQEIFNSESIRLRAYKCSAGVWTIGVGHTGPDVYEGLEITKEKAFILFAADIAKFEKDVHRLIPIYKLNQHQYDALISFTFNAGPGALQQSTLRKLIAVNANDQTIVNTSTITDKPELKEFLLKQGVQTMNIIEYNFYKWIWATNPKTGKKEIVPGLFNRRKKEWAHYNKK